MVYIVVNIIDCFDTLYDHEHKCNILKPPYVYVFSLKELYGSGLCLYMDITNLNIILVSYPQHIGMGTNDY